MPSPSDYLNRLEALGVTGIELNISTVEEAQSWLRKFRNHERQLRQIKREINLEISSIRNRYKEKTANASNSGVLLELLGKRKMAGRLRASEKRALSSQRDQEIEPYNKLKMIIDDLLIQIAAAKTQIQGWIEDVKSEQQSS